MPAESIMQEKPIWIYQGQLPLFRSAAVEINQQFDHLKTTSRFNLPHTILIKDQKYLRGPF